ncbi:MAG: SLC13 family permease [Parvibaculales bacterium]
MAVEKQRHLYQNIGLVLGPLVFLFMMIAGAPEAVMSGAAWHVAAVGIWMAVWWASEAIPVPMTAFLPIILFAPLGIASVKTAASSYAHPIIYLFLGGFMLALAVEKCNLHRRVALIILSATGTEGKKLVASVMGCCALLSMWMTNTSTTIMLLPIVLSLLVTITENIPDLDKKSAHNFKMAMLLGLAYGATMGGLATLIGTPPNALLAGFLSDSYSMEISFAHWMLVGIPLTLVLIPISWFILVNYIFPFDVPEHENTKKHLLRLKGEMGKMSKTEKRVALLFAFVVLSWIFRRPLNAMLDIGWLSDSSIAMLGALLLFIIPAHGSSKNLLAWEDTARLPWGVLVLFGGGLSLAAAISSSGLAQVLGSSLSFFGGFGIFVLLAASILLVIFLTELTSNLATTAALLPVIAALATELGIDPFILCIPITLAASCAFMLPVATPPNAVVFSSGLLTIPQMARAGIALNVISAMILVMLCMWWVPIIFG